MQQNQNSQKNIYLADDDDDDRALFAEALFEVDSTAILTQAEDGKQLMDMLNILKNPLPEVVFLDINMPKLDGFECLKIIRNHNGNLKKLNVIMFSTCNKPETIDRAFELGATFYAVKPNSYNDLKSLIKNVLQMNWFSTSLNKKMFSIV